MGEVATVLAVDDDPLVRADLRVVFEEAGFEVWSAGDGIEAVELARECRPDAVVLDLALPHMNGVEATRRILDERDVPIVALTGYGRGRGGFAEQAVAAGAVAVLHKPFAEQALVGAVKDALQRRVGPMRDASRLAIAELLGLLGYPESWAESLEAQAFAQGKIWTRTQPRSTEFT